MRVAIKEAWAAKPAFEREPKNFARIEQAALKEKDGLGHFIEKTHFPKLMAILQEAMTRTSLPEN